MKLEESNSMIIYIMCYYYSDLLDEILTDDEKTNDYLAIERIEELCREFKRSKIDNEDKDITDSVYEFLRLKEKEIQEGK